MPLPHIFMGAAAAAGLYDTLPKSPSSEQDQQSNATDKKNNGVKSSGKKSTEDHPTSIQSSSNTSDSATP